MNVHNHSRKKEMNSLRGMNVSKEMIIETAVTAETLDANVKGLHGPTEREIGKRAISRLAEEDEAEEETVNHLGHGPRSSGQAQRGGQRHGPPVNRPGTSSQQPGQQSCGNCGYAKHQSADQCPAIGKTCRICQKVNHFSRACRSEKAKQARNGAAGASLARKPSTTQPPPKKFHQISSEGKKIEVDEQRYSEFVRYMQANKLNGRSQAGVQRPTQRWAQKDLPFVWGPRSTA
jgi:hypothetical protein